MRKIINRRAYDTATATRVMHWDDGRTPNDFDHFEIDVYRKTTGEYFKAEYGPIWHNLNHGGMGWTITPLTTEEAKDAIEEYGDADTYEAEFGKAAE